MNNDLNEPNESLVPKTRFNIAVAAAVIFAIALAFAVSELLKDSKSGFTSTSINDGIPVPNDTNLTEFLEKNKFRSTLHVQDGGGIKVVNPSGAEQMVCGFVRKGVLFPPTGEVDPKCPPLPTGGIPVSSLNVVGTILITQINPTCNVVGGKLRCG